MSEEKVEYKVKRYRERCGNCRFFQEKKDIVERKTMRDDGSGVIFDTIESRSYCMRFPEHVERNAYDWCGEYRTKGE
jgi:hypothetical protein